MKTEHEISNIIDKCLQIMNEHQCHPLEAYMIIETLRYSTDVAMAGLQIDDENSLNKKLLGVRDKVKQIKALQKEKVRVKPE